MSTEARVHKTARSVLFQRKRLHSRGVWRKDMKVILCSGFLRVPLCLRRLLTDSTELSVTLQLQEYGAKRDNKSPPQQVEQDLKAFQSCVLSLDIYAY